MGRSSGLVASFAVVSSLLPFQAFGTRDLLAEDMRPPTRQKTQLKVREKTDVKGRITVAFTPDGKGVVTATLGGKLPVELWDAKTGKLLRGFEVPRQRAGSDSVAVTPDGKTLVTGTRFSRVFLWDLATGKQIRDIETNGFAMQVALSPDGNTLAFSGVRDTPISLFDVARGKEYQRTNRPEDRTSFVAGIAFAPDGKYFVSSGSSLVWYDTASGKTLRSVTPDAYALHSVAFSPDGKTIAAGDWGAVVRLYEAATGKETMALKGHDNRGGLGVYCVAFSPDGRLVASAGEDGTVRLWELLSRTERLCLRGHNASVVSVCFAPDGQSLVSGGMDGTARIWDLSFGAGSTKAESNDPKFFKDRWARLVAKDGADPFEAMCEMARAPRETISFLKERLPVISTEEIDRFVAQLDSNSFQDRERATAALEQLGEAAGKKLRRVLAARPTLEVRRRVELLLDRIDSPEAHGERLRRLRSVEILEKLDTTNARHLLELLAKGPPDFQQTQEAKNALRRLIKRRL